MSDTLPTITPYQFEGLNVCLVMIGDEAWFVASDPARALGYREAHDLTRLLDDDEKGTHIVRTPGGEQEVNVISEPGLYRAIIQRRANKKHDASLTARIGRFQRWVFHDILPSIRKTGGYGAPAFDPTRVLEDPAAMRGLLLTYTEKVLSLEAEKAEMQPKVAAYSRIAEANGSLCITDAAKNLQIKPSDLFKYLRTQGWIYRRPNSDVDLAYQGKLVVDLLEHKVTTVTRSDGSEKITTQVRVTPRGLARLAKELQPVV